MRRKAENRRLQYHEWVGRARVAGWGSPSVAATEAMAWHQAHKGSKYPLLMCPVCGGPVMPASYELRAGTEYPSRLRGGLWVCPWVSGCDEDRAGFCASWREHTDAAVAKWARVKGGTEVVKRIILGGAPYPDIEDISASLAVRRGFLSADIMPQIMDKLYERMAYDRKYPREEFSHAP